MFFKKNSLTIVALYIKGFIVHILYHFLSILWWILEDNYYPLTEIESLYLRVDKFTLWCFTNFSLFVSQVKSTLSQSLWCGSVGSATFLLPGSGSGSDKNMWIHGPESKGKISTKYCKKNLLLSKFKFKLLKKERLLKKSLSLVHQVVTYK